MTLECPGCHSRYEVPARPPGTRVRCRCQTIFTVPAPTEVAGALSCPKCGAPVSPDDPSCRYCHALLATAACPRCFGLLFQGTAFCPHCGAAVGEGEAAHATRAGASRRVCPRCQPAAENQLTAHLVGETLLDECHACGGLWIDAAALERVIADRDRQSALLSVAVGGAAAPPAAGPASIPELRYLHCPDCRVLMNRKNFGERSGVIVEICKAHGVWFDHDQLSRALRFVMSGGLEETKRRKLEELDRELERKRTAIAAASGGAYGGIGGMDPMRPVTPGLFAVGGALVDLLRHLF